MNVNYERQTSGNNSLQSTQLIFERPDCGRFTFSVPRQGMTIFDDRERHMVASQVEHETALDAVRMKFVLPPDASVLTFLNEHRTIPQILLEAATHLRASFAADTIFTLRAPVDESGSRTLYAVALWPGNVRDVRAALARFDETWWISHSRQAAGYLAFTYELV